MLFFKMYRGNKAAADRMTEEDHTDEEKLYEEMFAYRYTSEDPDYQATVTKPDAPCPCITGYFTRNRNQQDRNRGGRGGWGHRGGGGNWGQGRDQGHWQNRHHGQGHYGQGQGHGNYNNGGQRQGYGHDRGGGYNRHGGGQRYNPY